MARNSKVFLAGAELGNICFNHAVSPWLLACT
jgi:hypothetical protein